MQLITVLSAATALVGTASARSAVTENQNCNKAKPYAQIVNRCDYPVYLWSVFKGNGCPEGEMVTLNNGESYAENYVQSETPTGVSIKASKSKVCKGSDIVQLEYYLETDKPGFNFNYLDVSYVDCLGDGCPTKQEGYYLQAGSQTGASIASAGNTWCPILSCTDAVSCAKMSYILPDDVQTKSCGLDQSMTFYMCGGNAPTNDGHSSASSAPVSSAPVSSAPVSSAVAPASSSKNVQSSAPKPSTTLIKAVSSSAAYKVNAAAVTNAPAIKEAAKTPKVLTNVVYVTAYEYVNAKRHDHAHARRHQPFHA